MQAVTCPICEGSGRFGKFSVTLINTAEVSVDDQPICHGCGGKGWVEVSSEPIGRRPPLFDNTDANHDSGN